jgi:multidrug resistance efflux pump
MTEPNGNGNGNGHSNGNGHGTSQGVYLPKDRFSAVELTKPRLFPSKGEVVRKTGIWKNLLFFILILSAASAWFATPFSTVKDAEAVVVPARRVDFASPRDGFVERVFFKEGDFVKLGTPILLVESPEDEIQLSEATLEVEALGEEILAEEDEAQLLSLELQDAKELLAMGSAKTQTVEEARLKLVSKKKRIQALETRLAQARMHLEGLREKIRQGEIRSPFNGRIISDTGVKEASFVKAGEFLFTLASEDSLVEVLLKEADYARIEAGSKARVKFYAFPETTYEGEIIGFKHFAEPLPKSGIARNAVKALVRLNSIPSRIQNGMSAKVTLEAKQESLLRRYYHELF